MLSKEELSSQEEVAPLTLTLQRNVDAKQLNLYAQEERCYNI
jgi:hypothetical protein